MRRRPSPVLLVQLLACSLGGADPDGLGEMANMFRPEIRPFDLGLSARGEREPQREEDGTSFSSTTWRGSLSAQPYASDHDEWVLGVRCAVRSIECDGALPRTGPLPEHLYETYLSASYRYISQERWIYGAGLQVGGSGDRFASQDTAAFMVNLFLRAPVGAEDGLVVLLNEANNRTTLNYVPIPGVAYNLVRGRELNAMIGIPFLSVLWRPTPSSDVVAFGSPFGTAMVGAGVAPCAALPPLRLGVSMEWTSDSYRRADRSESDDVLYLHETKLTGHLGFTPRPTLGIDCYGGWIFQREAREGSSYSKAGDNRLDLPPGPVVGASARVRF